jgi:hypothetical protein
MAHLDIEFMGIKFPNPFVLASGPPTATGEMVIEAQPKRHAFSSVVDPKNMNKLPAGVVSGNLEQVSDSV